MILVLMWWVGGVSNVFGWLISVSMVFPGGWLSLPLPACKGFALLPPLDCGLAVEMPAVKELVFREVGLRSDNGSTAVKVRSGSAAGGALSKEAGW